MTRGFSRFARPILTIAAIAFVAAGCSDDDDDGGGGSTTQGNLQVFATDLPPELDRLRSVEVTIQRVQAVSAVTTGATGNTALLYDAALVGPQTIDLLPLKGGARALLASGPASPALYDRVQVFFSDIAINYETPSGVERFTTDAGTLIYGGEQQQGVDFVEFQLPPPGVDLEVGENEDILLDFDLASSIDVQGSRNDPTTITFTPVGQARNLTPTSGTLTGVVRTDSGTPNTTTDDVPVQNARVTLRRNNVVVAETLTDAGGVYVIEGLEGQYELLAVSPADPLARFEADTVVNQGQLATQDALLSSPTPN